MWIDELVFKHCRSCLSVVCGVPVEPLIVLGRSNSAERELVAERGQQDGIPILRRAGGGGAVILSPKTLIVSVGAWVDDYYKNDYFFNRLNRALITSLATEWPVFAKIEQRGISDLAYKDRKICGTSMFRSRNYLLYQASLLIADSTDLMTRYLAHPSREPEYRAGKDHQSFVTTLTDILATGYSIDPLAVSKVLRSVFIANIVTQLDSKIISAPPDQEQAILAKLTHIPTKTYGHSWHAIR